MKHLKLGLKIVFVGGLLYFLTRKGFISVQDTRRAFSQRSFIAAALGAYCVSVLLGVIRWQILLRAQGIRLKFMRVFQLTMVGNFFNIALPGAVSGDFVKAFYVGKEVQGLRARAFGSILFDRVSGLSALVLVSAGAILLGFKSFVGSEMLNGIRFFVSVSAVCVVVFYAYLFLVKEHHDPLLWLFKKIQGRVAAAGALTRVYEGLRHYHNHRLAVIQVVVISVAIQLLVGWAAYQFVQAFGVEGHLLSIYVIVPLGLLITAIPVLPAGVGTGHAAFLYLFKLIGSDRGADIFSLVALSNILIGALGGLVYLRFRSHEPKPVLAESGEMSA